MSLCEICKKNEAVLFVQLSEDDSGPFQGICLSCAMKEATEEVREYLRACQITEQNVEEVTELLNHMARGGKGAPNLSMSPEEQKKLQEILEQIRKTTLESFAEQGGGVFDSEGNRLDWDSLGEEQQSNISAILEQLGIVGNKRSNQSDAQEGGVTDEAEETEAETENESDSESESGLGAFLEQMRNMLVLPSSQSAPEFHQESTEATREEQSADSEVPAKRTKKKFKFLKQFGTDLTERAREGKLDQMIGRQEELNRVIQILNRRNKNNPVLLGDPGVGKTAIAEGLATRIAAGQVPPKLRDMHVFLLDMTAMVAGTQFRGQFENRMKGVVDEASAAGNVILVIDELHSVVSAGDAEGVMNAANILKPALGKGSLRVLGSTTLDEYRRFIEKDSALERRFQQVLVEEPSPEMTLEILKGVRPYYEEHHHVRYSDAVLEAAIRYAQRYIHSRFFPDKAIDLLDEAGSKANLGQLALVREKRLQEILQETDIKLEALQTQIAEAEEEKRLQLYEQQAHLKEERAQTEKELQLLQPLLEPVEITKEDIAAVVELWTGIPVRSITEAETERLLDLEARLQKRVIGQEEAVQAVSRAIRRSRAGFGRENKPASFLFVGPTGVGKTELVKALSEVLFDDEKTLIRMDMSEYMESHTVSKLIGSPPGYVGYDDGGQLTEKVRRHPYSVLLFDEIEKAHADVFNILLQILDEGRLTDSHGKVVNFSNTVIILTSNVGTSTRSTTMGFGSSIETARKEQVHKALQEVFRPEFLNRIDEIIVFRALQKAELLQICDLQLQEVVEALQRMQVGWSCTDAARDHLVQKGYSPQYGARPLRRTIRRLIEDPLAEYSLKGLLNAGSIVRVDESQEENEDGDSLQIEILPASGQQGGLQAS